MKKVFQTKRGIGGDCLAACLASIFEVNLRDMPNLAPPECFTDWTVQAKLRNQWLRDRHFDYLEIDVSKLGFAWTQGAVPMCLCLFAVESPTPEMREKGYGHFVVGWCKETTDAVNYEVAHDPMGELRDDYKITAIGIIVPLEIPGMVYFPKAASASGGKEP